MKIAMYMGNQVSCWVHTICVNLCLWGHFQRKVYAKAHRISGFYNQNACDCTMICTGFFKSGHRLCTQIWHSSLVHVLNFLTLHCSAVTNRELVFVSSNHLGSNHCKHDHKGVIHICLFLSGWIIMTPMSYIYMNKAVKNKKPLCQTMTAEKKVSRTKFPNKLG